MHPINVTNKPSNPISPTPSCAGLSRASTSCTPQEDIPSLLQSDETLAAAEQWAQGTAHDRFAVAPQVLFIQLTRRRDQQLSNAAARSFCENGHYGKAQVLISGAGIAGCTLAYWLTRNGHCATLVERSGSLRSS